jgi:hypothetical protein
MRSYRHRHILLIALALVAITPPALAQLPASPSELPGFTRKKDGDGRTWWHRRAEGWDYFAAPSPDAWMHPPLAIVANNDRAVRGIAQNFGLNLQAWEATRSAPGFSSGGGRNPDSRPHNSSAGAANESADDTAAPDPEASADPIELFCRRYHVPVAAVYAALGGGGGILGVLLALALRRLLNR